MSTKKRSHRSRKNRRNRRPSQGRVDSAPAASVVVNNRSKEWLNKSFDRVYNSEVLAHDPKLSAGDSVSIIDSGGAVIGRGIWSGMTSMETQPMRDQTARDQDEERIVVRRYRESEGPVDRYLFKELAEAALFRRSVPDDTTCFRWIHEENDDFPGIRVDVWGTELAVLFGCESLLAIAEELLYALSLIRPFQRVWGHVRLASGAQRALGMLWGDDVPDESQHSVVVRELGLSFVVRPQLGRDAGLFEDMRGLRSWLSERWEEQRVLNLFCYSGAFSVAAAACGAQEVHSVDLSEHYLDHARENFRVNGLDEEQHIFQCEDSFQALDRYRRQREGFDIVIADPPSYSHSPRGVWSVQNDLKKLVVACLRVTVPGGLLIVATNHGKMPPRDFSKAILEAAHKEKRRLRLILDYYPQDDFPAALHFPMARYLKCWVLRVG